MRAKQRESEMDLEKTRLKLRKENEGERVSWNYENNFYEFTVMYNI